MIVIMLEYDSDQVNDSEQMNVLALSVKGWKCIMFVIIMITDYVFVIMDVLCSADKLYLTDKKTSDYICFLTPTFYIYPSINLWEKIVKVSCLNSDNLADNTTLHVIEERNT